MFACTRGAESGDFLSTWPSVKLPRPRLAFRMCQAPSTLMISRLLSPCIKSQIKFQKFLDIFVPLLPRKLGRTQLQAFCLLLFKARGEKRKLHATSLSLRGRKSNSLPPPFSCCLKLFRKNWSCKETKKGLETVKQAIYNQTCYNDNMKPGKSLCRSLSFLAPALPYWY